VNRNKTHKKKREKTSREDGRNFLTKRGRGLERGGWLKEGVGMKKRKGIEKEGGSTACGEKKKMTNSGAAVGVCFAIAEGKCVIRGKERPIIEEGEVEGDRIGKTTKRTRLESSIIRGRVSRDPGDTNSDGNSGPRGS